MLATASVLVDAPVSAAFSFLTDRLSYLVADSRLADLNVLSKDGDGALIKVRGYVVSPYLVSTALLRVTMRPGIRIGYRSEPRTISFPARLAMNAIHGSYELHDQGGRTKITKTEAYETKDSRFGRWLERRGDPWLREHLQEVALPRLKHLLEERRADASL